jgi:pectinesterase
VITFDLNANAKGADGRPMGTFRTPTAVIDADDFTAENLTFENAAGPVGQALAIPRGRRSGRFPQLPLPRLAGHGLPQSRTAVLEDSYIQGHIDFIFGGATAYFLAVSYPLPGEMATSPPPATRPRSPLWFRLRRAS